MFDNRGTQRTFFTAPQSISSLLAAFLDPAIAGLCYLTILSWHGLPLGRADLTLCLLVFAITFPGLNRFREAQLNALVDISLAWLQLLVILAVCGWATQSIELFDRDVLLTWVLLTPVLQFVACLSGRWLLRHLAQRPENRRLAVVVGAGPLGVKVAQALVQRPEPRVQFEGYFDDRQGDRIEADALPALAGPLDRLAPAIAGRGIHEVYITLPLGSQPRIVALLEQLQATTASVFYVPDVFGITIIQGRLRDMGGIPIVGLCETPFTGTPRLVKRVSDLMLGSLILALVTPLLLVIAVAVRWTSPGPAIFRQRRNGLDGEEIVVYKFRTMTVLDDGPNLQQARRDDPRITRIGAFLRRTSLDELPQFINVLQGRMSIVGPRPHAVAHNEQYRQLIKAYMVRHKVRPGITGWAQIHGHRGETDTIDKMRARVEYDLEYLRNWSLGLDLRIIARTLKLLIADRNAF